MANLLINQGTNSAINFDLSGTVNTQVVGIGYGTVSTIGTLPNLPGGSIVVTAATISSLPNIPGGSVVQTAGTVNTGTINTGTINLGTVVGKDANAAAQTGNPVTTGGTDSGGTVYTLRLDTKGQQFIGGGTVDTLTTVANLTNGSVRITVGTITVLPNLPQGSINVTAGTVNAGTINTGTINAGTINLGTVVGKDANAAAQTGNPLAVGGTDSGGTVRTIKVDSGGLLRTGLDSGTITVLARYFRINVTGIATGTVAGIIELFTHPAHLQNTTIGNGINLSSWNGVQLSVGGTIADAINGTSPIIAAENTVYNGATWDRARSLVGAASNGGTGVAAVAQAFPSFKFITGAGTTTVKSGAGVIHTLNIGSILGAGTLYNSAGTSANIIWTATTPNPQTLTFDVAYGSLTYAGSGATNVTIVYY
jgi:hypothetical protein